MSPQIQLRAPAAHICCLQIALLQVYYFPAAAKGGLVQLKEWRWMAIQSPLSFHNRELNLRDAIWIRGIRTPPWQYAMPLCYIYYLCLATRLLCADGFSSLLSLSLASLTLPSCLGRDLEPIGLDKNRDTTWVLEYSYCASLPRRQVHLPQPDFVGLPIALLADMISWIL